MYVRKAHKIWIEQCDAAQTIKARFGLTAAFDYLVGEKLLSFASAASRHPDFARELSRFVSEVRRMLTPDEIGIHQAALPAEGELHVHARLQVGTLPASGFQADLFYP